MSERVLVLGAYGFIGSEIVRACLAAGFAVRGLGRDAAHQHDRIEWITGDLARMNPANWDQALDGIDFVVNAAGALQDSARDDLAGVHANAMQMLAEASARAGVHCIVQISAVGVARDASTEFLSTKARGDQALLDGPVPVVLLRPGLVLGRTVYGGTALIRMLAAVPFVQPVAHANVPVQVIGMDDLCSAALTALWGDIPDGTVADLVASEPETLGSVVLGVRRWLGFGTAPLVAVPGWVAGLTGRMADALGHLGWRSPLRSTALNVMAEGVTGDPEPWCKLTGQSFAPLSSWLAANPATLQDRWHARLALLMPVLVAVLAAFWLASGLIGLAAIGAAADVLTKAGWSVGSATAAVATGAFIDIALGLGILVRRMARTACLGTMAVSLGYLLAGTIFIPQLWADPLGPLVKVFPGILLAGVTWVLLEDR